MRFLPGISCLGLWLAWSLSGCGGSNPAKSATKVYAPEDMPEICEDIDFNQSGSDIKDVCGVQTRNYKAYRNIPEHRNLLQPKGGKIVKKGKALELRLQNTLPIALPTEFEGRIQFDERLRRTFLKSKMDYCEFFPENSTERLRLISLQIPMDTGGDRTLCYKVESRPATGQRNSGYAGRLEPVECQEFQRIKKIAQSQNQPHSEGTGMTSGQPEGMEREKP